VNSSYPLPLFGGVIQQQRRALPSAAIAGLTDYRHACRLAWKLRQVKGMTRRTLAEVAGLYASHVSDYFSVNEAKRDLPADRIAAVEAVLGNSVISQFLARQCGLTVLEELNADRRAAA
jgi:hypothetical protein